MLMTQERRADRKAALARLLGTYSVEVTARDTRSLEEVMHILPSGTEVFVANLPNESAEVLVKAAARLQGAGLTPVPHIVARNIAGRGDLEHMLAGLSAEAGVDRALVLGGDRDRPAGEFDAALQIIESGLLEKNGIRRIAMACYPEGHPRISDAVLKSALKAKLDAARKAGLDTLLVSQFLFDPQPIVDFASALRKAGIEAPLRVGVAGPADRTKLIKYALRCGVGASLRVLRERGELARNVLSGETPDELLGAVALAQMDDPALGISGAHFFTFGDPARSARWAEEQRRGAE
ncbi:methylenetetrahydrofolate reductase [Chelativorans sp. AA-79]|uniref:methylenetetrahydrofolate reductase n=1 Tax=Chelativorans sp. AA-79 TaxID=3028735 RepID=UPI0023F69984|nr:methylenetetrahydrofolate reductase [Chelativorans sp. AA-79]WEX10397.1 methylenetetrahydrofolate reductase [Chelativorans sp. AA-79]